MVLFLLLKQGRAIGKSKRYITSLSFMRNQIFKLFSSFIGLVKFVLHAILSLIGTTNFKPTVFLCTRFFSSVPCSPLYLLYCMMHQATLRDNPSLH